MDMKTDFKYGVSSGIFGHRDALTPRKIEVLAATELDCIEIAALQDLHVNLWDDSVVNELLESISASRLDVWSIHAPFCGLCMDDPDSRAYGVRRMVHAAECAERFGATRMVVHPGRDTPSVDFERESQWMIDGVNRALDAMPESVVVAIESMEKNSLFDTPEKMLGLIGHFPAERVGVCLDVGHVNLGLDIVPYIEALSGRIVTVHLQDNNGTADNHFLIGDGQIDWTSALDALRRAGYSGVMMSEGDSPSRSLEENITTFIQRIKGFSAAQG